MRVQKTDGRIAAAFVALLHVRSYDRIRVSDITRKARVGRATFYAHFASKDALFKSELTRIVEPMLRALPEESCLVDCSALFAHVGQVRKIYQSLTAGPSKMVTERLIQDAVEARIATILANRRNAKGGVPAFVPRFVAATVLTLIAWSLEQAVSPNPAELQAMFRSLVGRAIAPIPQCGAVPSPLECGADACIEWFQRPW